MFAVFVFVCSMDELLLVFGVWICWKIKL